MTQISRSGDDFEILITSSLAQAQPRVLKSEETFAVFDRQGEIRPLGFESHGVYREETRYLSRLLVRIEGKRPILLSSTIKEENDLFTVDATNPDFLDAAGTKVRGDTVHLFQSVFLWKDRCYGRIRLSNYGQREAEFTLTVEFDADFADIFEVRGHKREKRGKMRKPLLLRDRVTLSYEGMDGVIRETSLLFHPAPRVLTPGRAEFPVTLRPREHLSLYLTVSCAESPHGPPSSERGDREEAYERVFERARSAVTERVADACRVETSHERFNLWVDRSTVDIFTMLTETKEGLYPYAGIPWYSTIFGRDGIITALSVLTVNPRIAEGVLRYLAANQARDICPEREAEPGKILHEVRRGEMARLKEVPFDFYYGSVDSTPLFILLAGRYFERTRNLALIRELWPAIELALAWIDRYGDLDGDGFVEYASHGKGGLRNQGWKDSEDAVFHANGDLAEAPIALCEVQGYVYEARRKAAVIARALGEDDRASSLLAEAEELRRRFHQRFWCEEIGMYALALDGDKRPCRVRSSNAGQCLFSGIAEESAAQRITEQLMGEAFFTGWGVRTIASGEARYNPMSYHNGSVWPHDNAMIAAGMSRYGLKDAAARILTGLFEASLNVDLHRLPELFCGFIRRPGEGPTLYPVACSPQTWASAAVYLLLEACLGFSVEGETSHVRLRSPHLPGMLEAVKIKNLAVGSSRVDMMLKRHGQDVSFQVARQGGDAEVIATR